MCERSEPKPRVLKGRDISAWGKRGTSAAPGTPPQQFISLSSSGGEGRGEEAIQGTFRLVRQKTNQRPGVDVGWPLPFARSRCVCMCGVTGAVPVRRCEQIEESANFHADFLGK